MSFGLIAIIVFIIIVILLWKTHMRARENAIVVALRICKKWDALLLDDTVCLMKLRIGRRSENGRLCFFREYAFEYTFEGSSRFKAYLHFNGLKLIQIISEDLPITPMQSQADPHNSIHVEGNNVIDISDFKHKD
ncbi:MAG: DUF3301 domain-containing protein [Francisellaceae bacterium]